MTDAAIDTVTHRVVTTAGHVDHGKSTLLRALTGQEPDRLREEQQRGLTIELGYVWGSFGAHTVAFVDVPGHERFISTMLAGTGASPAVLFVVAADDGWSKQSAEHRDILALLGVPGVATVITKADTVSPQRLAEVAAAVTEALAGTTLAQAPQVATDAVSGRGLDTLRQVLSDRLDVLDPPVSRHRPRLFVDRAFAMSGAGAVVTGTLLDGTLQVDDEVRVLPAGMASRIRSMQSLGRPVRYATAGSRVALNLAQVSHHDLNRGDTIVGSEPWSSTTEMDCWLTVLPGQKVGPKGAWEVYVGSAASPASVQLVGANDTDVTAVRLRLARKLVVRAGDRFVLRESGRRRVVAGGIVCDPAPPVLPRGATARQAHAKRVELLASSEPAIQIALLADTSDGVCDLRQLHSRAGWDPYVPLPDTLVAHAGVALTQSRLAGVFETLRHLGPGVHTREQVAQALATARLSDASGKAVLAVAMDRKVLARVPGGFVLPEHLDDAERVRLRRVALLLAELDVSPFAPPPLDVVAEQVGLTHRDLAVMTSKGLIVKVGDLTFTADALTKARHALVTLAKTTPTFTASDARQAWDTTRKYAIPLLEYFDRTGVTRFDGQFRTLV